MITTQGGVRLAVRALILDCNRLLMVNAYPGDQSDLWCAPGGGVIRGQSLADNLIREVHEECGVTIEVGAPCLINEFHDPVSGFHQAEIFFCARIKHGSLGADWVDTAGIVNRRRLVTRDELRTLRHKPDSLGAVAWGDRQSAKYDPLELIVP